MGRQLSGAAATRSALISAALKLFGEHGYDAVSTRQIADHAAANIGSIAYHFGGKPGLRIACVEYVISAVVEAMGAPLTQSPPSDLSQDEAMAVLEEMFTNLVRVGAQRPDSEDISTFLMREMVMPGEIHDHIYTGMVRPLHERVEQLFGIATGAEGQTDDIKLTVFTLMGQTMSFRLCKPALMRRMGWNELGDAETEALIDAIRFNLRAIVAWRRQTVASQVAPNAPIALFG
ncbi:CerR family C-terminal domain-containing protein [Rhizobium sp. RU36D]|uniref:CerR family C-terminal domain-containing protein n=1 Tax=Rhizobium sp. RU36D TaxID=1907415 RepID=UPI0009D8EB98|nr:CerR family C-terminal domain-containing protein [Rhizobium sp. RU36D]SMC62294.1 transcriptional regulator, TetR family [Rhizobium sp. RU36D]